MLRRATLALAAFATVAFVAACADDEPSSPSATLASGSDSSSEESTTTTRELTVEEEVEAAYLRSWDVYSEAMSSLDASPLADAYVDRALELRTEEVESLAAAGTPARMAVDHDYSISVADDGTTALVVDHYVNHSVLIDPDTGEPTEADPNTAVSREYEMRLVEGSWKVAQVFEA